MEMAPKTSPSPNSDVEFDADETRLKTEEPIEEEGGVRRIRRFRSGVSSAFRPLTVPLRFRPFRLIVLLVLIILLLLLLIWKLGLGGGGGNLLPGGGSAGDKPSEPPAMIDPAREPAVRDPDKPIMRREIIVSFLPQREEPTLARELCCSVSWVAPETDRPETRLVETDNMRDFEYELERTIRFWRQSLGSEATNDQPIVAVRMVPFPGEGVFRKVEAIARKIDARMSLLRIENP